MRRAILLLLVMAGAPLAAEAQERGPTPAPASPDFLIGRPSGSLALRGSWVMPRAGSDLFDFVQRELTIDNGDFNTGAFAVDYGLALTSRTEAIIGVEANRASVASEYRAFVDNDRQPIEQTTSLTELNISGSLKFALAPRGREVGSFAWVPRRVVPFVGAGGGARWYQFKQAGDFIDALDQQPTGLAIFTDELESRGWAPSAHVFGGVDVHLHRRWYATLDARYLWSSATLGRDFQSFEPIDLAGFRVGAGINMLF